MYDKCKMRMKILDVIVICNSGFDSIICDSISVESKYKVLKFKYLLRKAFEFVQSLEKSLLDNCEIQDIQELEKRIKELKDIKYRTEEEEAELADSSKKLDTYLALRKQMLEDQYTFNNVSLISYEDWLSLRKENRDNENLNNYIEDILNGVL